MAKLGRPPAERIEVTCTCCGKTFTKPSYAVEANKTGRFFCSLACRNQVGSKPRTIPERTCEICGVMFRPPQRRAPGRFCSKACADAWQGRNKVERTCEQCGKTFTLHPSWEKFSAGRFCSKACEAASRTTRVIPGRQHNGKPVTRNRQGYALIWQPDHPKASHGRVLEHRYIVEQRLGRHLDTEEQVHHINGNKIDNRDENLALISPRDHTVTTLAEAGMRRAADQAYIRKLEAELAQYRHHQAPSVVDPDLLV